MNPSVQFRRAVLSDCREIAVVKRWVWETTYRGIYPDVKLDRYDLPAQEEKFASLVRSEKTSLYVAEEAGSIVGYMCYGEHFRKAFGKTYEITLLYVRKEYQGQGIGRQFFRIAKDGLRRMGCTEFLIACNKYNVPAQDFYRAMGGRLIRIDEDHADRSIPQVYFAYLLENEKTGYKPYPGSGGEDDAQKGENRTSRAAPFAGHADYRPEKRRSQTAGPL